MATSSDHVSPGTLRLAVVADEPPTWLTRLDLPSSDIIATVLLTDGEAPDGLVERRISTSPMSNGHLPDFADLVSTLRELDADALLVTGDSALSRLAAVACDLDRRPVFTLVTTGEQLANLGSRRKDRPDLFFIADGALHPEAMKDPRYGSTMLSTGDPRDDSTGEMAGARLLGILDRWRHDRLDPETPDLSIVVPAYREEGNIPLVCERLLAMMESAPFSAEIILVDDASPDATFRVAQEQMVRSPRVRAYSKPPPRGMGNGIRFGLSRARAPIVAVTMGDGSDEVSRIPEMYARVHDDGYGLAIGSRYRHRRNRAAIPIAYRFWSACFRWTTRLVVGLKLKDYTNAFRVFRRDIFARYGPEGGGFEISPEITFKAWFATRRVVEVDVCHLKRASGQSSFSFLRAGPGYGKMLIKAFVNRLTGRWFVLDW